MLEIFYWPDKQMSVFWGFFFARLNQGIFCHHLVLVVVIFFTFKQSSPLTFVLTGELNSIAYECLDHSHSNLLRKGSHRLTFVQVLLTCAQGVC